MHVFLRGCPLAHVLAPVRFFFFFLCDATRCSKGVHKPPVWPLGVKFHVRYSAVRNTDKDLWADTSEPAAVSFMIECWSSKTHYRYNGFLS